MKFQGCILRKVMLGIFVLLAVSMGYGQSGIKVNIPFEFSSGTQTFPAGEYTLRPLLKVPHTLFLQDQTGQTLSYIATNSIESRDRASLTKLIFSQYGGRYFLAQMWLAGSDTGWETSKSPVEIQLARYSPGQQMALLSVDSQ
jgi:hypothetical protein